VSDATTRRVRSVRLGAAAAVIGLVLWGTFGVQRDDRTGLRSVSDTEQLLAELGPGHHLAYAVENGVTLIDFDTGLVQRVAQFADRIATLPPFLLLYDGGHTIAIDPDVPEHLRVFVTGSRAIATDQEGTFAFAVVDDVTGDIVEVFTGRNDAGWLGQTLPLPEGATTLEVQGLGFLVSPPEGGTLVAGLTEFEEIADGRVISAVPGAWVEVRCDPGCEPVLVDLVTTEEFSLPRSFADDDVALVIAPDTSWIIESTDESSRFVDPRTGYTVEIGGGAGGRFAWAPDSSYTIWLTEGSSAPAVHFAFTDGRPPIAVSLAALDAESKVGDAILLY